MDSHPTLTPPPRMDARQPIFLAVPHSAMPASQFAGQRVHFIGIGGCGMSGLANMLLDCGAIVSGSDPGFNEQTGQLVGRGARITRDQMGELLNKQVDLVVRTAAVPDTNLEYLAARKLGLRVIKYAHMLGLVMGERFGVAVAGTHGKSTTAAMISFALRECGLDPSYVIGGSVRQLGGGSHSGTGNSMIVEACEYDRSFLNLQARVAVITNIEEDHLDYYKDIDDIVAAFAEFARRTPADGLVIANGQDSRVTQALGGCPCKLQTVGFGDEGCDWVTQVEGVEAGGGYAGHVRFAGRSLGKLRLSVPGKHNLYNATVALAACVACGAEPAQAIAALNQFTGVDRRMTEMGRCNGAILVDDYGHHPTEIQATLTAIREKYHPRRLFCVFQPHQHSRTRFLMEDFAVSFTLATETIVPDIYFVRDSETDRQRVSAIDLVQRIRQNGQSAQHLPGFDAIADYLRGQAQEGDLILTMGAGNVWEIARALGGS